MELDALLPALMFLSLILGLFSTLPVGLVLMAVTLVFGGIAISAGEMRFVQVTLMPNRIFGGIIENPVLVAAPMFIFMGMIMEKTRIAEDLLIALQKGLRVVPGGLALAVTLMGTILAAATGIIGASVVMLTVLALPTMLDKGYSPALAAGTVASAGTLGILIPPSIMLVFMGDLLTLNLAKLFIAAFLPGLALSAIYVVYIVIRAWLDPASAPAAPKAPPEDGFLLEFLVALALPLGIIVAVLGSILGGFATPTEASGVGAFAALVLGFLRGRMSFVVLSDAMDRSIRTIAMLFFIFVGATAFSYVFRHVGGEHFIINAARSLNLGDWGLLAMMMLMIFIMGFFFDWIEITLILLPIFTPIIQVMDLGTHIPRGDLIYWFAVLMAVNLQTSFLTPPFGFALFYLKGAARDRVSMGQIYRGIIPFVILQLTALALFVAFPQIVMYLPNALLN
jgi:tripartite ATP-independent transporter DctM subunit